MCNLGKQPKTPMFVLMQRYVRRTVLVLMLWLAASANCLSVSYDTNENDDIPPVSIHFCFVASGKRVTAGKRAVESGSYANGTMFKAATGLPVIAEVKHVSTSELAGSPNLVVPLRR